MEYSKGIRTARGNFSGPPYVCIFRESIQVAGFLLKRMYFSVSSFIFIEPCMPLQGSRVPCVAHYLIRREHCICFDCF